ncbi:MAG: winged helix-turn-helix domain-containing protein, partial [Gemmatimonadaceae bacterium]
GVGANGGRQPAAAPRPRARPEPEEAPYVRHLESAAPGPAARGRRGAHVLTVSSDAETRVGLAVLLEAEGYTHSAPVGLHAAIAAEHAERPDLLVLDVGCDAPQTALLFAAARDTRRGPPAVFLVPPDGGADLPGFRAGTDCIVARPLSPALVLGAVRRLLAAGNPERPAPTGARYRVGPVELDVARGIVTRDGVDVRLSPTLLRALVQLARAEGRVVSRRELWRAVWDADARAPTRTIDTCIHALRRVLEADPAHPAVLITYNRRGYRLICERVE